jgi:flavorubredoxin
MTTTSSSYGTRIDEIDDGLFRISTPMPTVPGGFSFNQYLIRDDASLLFHTGPRALFGPVCEAISKVMRLEDLRYLCFSHIESDECGSLNPFLAIAPQASPLCGRIAAMVSVTDLADRPPVVLADAQTLSLGRHQVRWFDAPHVPHGWECGFLMDDTAGALLCGDLFTQAGAEHPPVTEGDILEPSEAMRQAMDYFAHGPDTPRVLEKLAATSPGLLACMHGSAFRGDGASALRELARRLG